MLLKRNLLETLAIVSCVGTLICVLLNYLTNISPITGIWFTVYFLFVFILSILFSFKFIQWLLHLNKPINYDLEDLLKIYPQFSFLTRVLPKTKKKVANNEFKEYDTNELSVISSVLERKLVSSWYVPYISEEIGFPFACKQMLDQMIGKTFQICNKTETKDVYIDICSILVSHLKEYKRALKRHESAPNEPIESLYKKSHSIWNTSNKVQPADHCANILRVLLKELVSWELWETPHLELLVRILAKKLDNFIESTLADPIWINDKLMNALKCKEGKKEYKDEKPVEVKEEIKEKKEAAKDLQEVKSIVKELQDVKPETTIESALSTVITKSTAPILQRAINESIDDEVKLGNIIEEVPVTSSEPVDIKSSPVLRQRRGRQGRNEVKIYDRIIEGSVKTWESDMDLQCISLGQDLLASLDGEITLSRLWGQDTEADGSPNPPRSKSPQTLWFGEEDTMDLELDTSPKERSPVKKEQSPKPADALLKDLQSTVHQAKTKIGDLQDEAAGMMEGLLDFGIAGLKKGLRFTGLSDDSQDKSPSSHKERGVDKISPAEINKKPENKEAAIPNAPQKDDVSSTQAPPLLKQQRVISQDSLPSQAKPIPAAAGVPRAEPPPVPLCDSPEPEYEEAADLSTSIAKLRCLLQQRAEASSRPEEVWWEGAEETRGRSASSTRPGPVDTAALADEYDMNADRNSSPGQTSNNMQRLDKLFQRTVTGVFNSIKTAVGAEGAEVAGGAGVAAGGAGPVGPPGVESAPQQQWTYVCTSGGLSVCGAVSRAVCARRAHAHVDAALDTLHAHPHHQHHHHHQHQHHHQRQQQHARQPRALLAADDFEECLWCRWRGWCGAGAAAAAAGLAASHVAQRLAALLGADLAESLIDAWLAELTTWLRQQVFAVFRNMAQQADLPTSTQKEPLMEFNKEETVAAILERMPALYLFGEETLSRAVTLLVSSFTHKDVNRDLAFRTLDVLALHFKKSAALGSMFFDGN
ncbi:uncharacterized protein LOC113522112 isoform X2 [Galleria mellonella]|uniref:Uncharacterized protein LOC113522112 isoform X2 n=1 Tax=Galleria mellonella TaxID=7137 RepID=A0ABM3MDZ9_GALME|nr:uncharacterized protein LOC113522112 isoform X2 [Galleria mellonella]